MNKAKTIGIIIVIIFTILIGIHTIPSKPTDQPTDQPADQPTVDRPIVPVNHTYQSPGTGYYNRWEYQLLQRKILKETK